MREQGRVWSWGSSCNWASPVYVTPSTVSTVGAQLGGAESFPSVVETGHNYRSTF